MTVHSNLRKNLGVKPFKPQLQPKLTEKQKNVRLSFCRERKKWSVHDLRKYYSLTSLLSNYFTHQIAKMIEFSSQTDSTYYLTKPSNFREKCRFGA